MTKDPNIGRIIAKRYQLVDLIGTGAMGRVYRAEDKSLGDATVAVKFLSQTLLNNKMRERFEREATICAHLAEKSIHIVGVRDYGIDLNQVPFYVMEYLQGECLSDILEKVIDLELPRFIKLSRQICVGMDSAHKGIIFKGQLSPIIHRDIKPSNIFIIHDPTIGELVKILDFGIAKLIQPDVSQTHSFMGTLAYCSPEQMEGKELDNRSDIYSLGVMMYEMLSNDMPFFPETSSFGGWYKAHHDFKPKSFEPNLKIPIELQNLIFKCLAKEPSDRPQTTSDILKVLDNIEVTPSKTKKKINKYTLSSTPNAATVLSSVDEFYYQIGWPEDKPQQKIVFPKIMTTTQGFGVTLWVMLENQDIMERRASMRYNQFLFLGSPHPMVLWITVLYNKQYNARWLPCYLDLKTDTGQQVARLLGESGNYQILFFALNQPEHCKHVMDGTIADHQRKLLKDWANDSQVAKSSGKPQISKRFLKQEFEKLKPQIIMKLEKQA